MRTAPSGWSRDCPGIRGTACSAATASPTPSKAVRICSIWTSGVATTRAESAGTARVLGSTLRMSWRPRTQSASTTKAAARIGEDSGLVRAQHLL